MMAVFVDAAELLPAERPAFIAQACGDDAELRAEVESLLAAHDGDAQFLESPLTRPADTPDLDAQLQSALGTAFRVERELARGGMSRVFVAEETNLGRHVGDQTVSYYIRSPGGFFLEYGWDGLPIDAPKPLDLSSAHNRQVANKAKERLATVVAGLDGYREGLEDFDVRRALAVAEPEEVQQWIRMLRSSAKTLRRLSGRLEKGG